MVAPSIMLASFPASLLKNRSDLGILNRFGLNPSRSSGMTVCEMLSLFAASLSASSGLACGGHNPGDISGSNILTNASLTDWAKSH